MMNIFDGHIALLTFITLMTLYVAGAALYLWQSKQVGAPRLQAIAESHDLFKTAAIRPFVVIDANGHLTRNIKSPEFYKENRPLVALVSIFTVFAFSFFLLQKPESYILKDYSLLIDFGQTHKYEPCGNQGQPNCAPVVKEFRVAAVSTMMVGFLSAYIWSITMMLRRVMARDVSVMAFNQVSARIVISVILSLIVFHIVPVPEISEATPLTGPVGENAYLNPFHLLMAFFIGFFPETVIRYLGEKARAQLQQREQSDFLGLEFVEGIDVFIRSRLAEAEIYDAQGLATSNPINVLFRTPYNISQIIDWIGQAQIYVLLKKDHCEQLRKIGIRTSFQLYECEEIVDSNGIRRIKGANSNLDAAVVKASLANDFAFRRAYEVHEALLASTNVSIAS